MINFILFTVLALTMGGIQKDKKIGADDQKEIGAFIAEINGKAILLPPDTAASKDTKVACDRVAGNIRIDSEKHKKFPLVVGSQICSISGRIRLRLLTDQGDKYKFIVPADGLYLIESLPKQRFDNRKLEQVAGRSAGPKMSPSSIVIYPANLSVVRPEKLIIKWIPQPEGSKVSISVIADQINEIWKEVNVNGNAGELVSEDLRSRLEDIRDKLGHRKLRMLVRIDNERLSYSDFGLLTRVEAESLNNNLKVWEEEQDDLIRLIGIAGSFAGYGLNNEAASTWEDGLRKAPQSIFLIRKSIDANLMIGNKQKVQELTSMLPTGVSAEEDEP